MYLTGLKNELCKNLFSFSDNFSDKTFIGIDDVFDETIDPCFLFLKIFS